MPVDPMPEQYRGVTSYLVVGDGAAAIDFYVSAFGAEVVERIEGPGGAVMHAELELGGGRFMMAQETPGMGFRAPEAYGGSPISLFFYVPDSGEVFARAIEAGATVVRPVKDQFYGDRSGTLTDPFGHTWTIATHVEDVPSEELERRASDAMKDCEGN